MCHQSQSVPANLLAQNIIWRLVQAFPRLDDLNAEETEWAMGAYDRLLDLAESTLQPAEPRPVAVPIVQSSPTMDAALAALAHGPEFTATMQQQIAPAPAPTNGHSAPPAEPQPAEPRKRLSRWNNADILREVEEGVQAGLTNQEIADKYSLGKSTVSKYAGQFRNPEKRAERQEEEDPASTPAPAQEERPVPAGRRFHLADGGPRAGL